MQGALVGTVIFVNEGGVDIQVGELADPLFQAGPSVCRETMALFGGQGAIRLFDRLDAHEATFVEALSDARAFPPR